MGENIANIASNWHEPSPNSGTRVRGISVSMHSTAGASHHRHDFFQIVDPAEYNDLRGIAIMSATPPNAADIGNFIGRITSPAGKSLVIGLTYEEKCAVIEHYRSAPAW